MPLLGKKSYSFASPPDEIQQNDEVFVIKQTNEVFKSYEEYVDKILLYSSQIWSCQYTGKSMLSFEDALESEENALKSVDKFPKCFKKAVLNTAHHWTSGLEALVDKCHKDIHSNFNEKDAVNVNTGSKVHSGHVVNVHTDEEDLPPSPLSDKENLDDQDGKPSSKKFYDVLCKDSGECLKNVKAANISHSEKCPSKNLISLFIRANLAHPVGMGGQTTAFVLKKDVLEKYSIPHKLKEFSVSKKNANSEPLATIQHVNNSKPKKSTEKPKKCSPEKPLSDSKPKGKKLDPLQRSLDFFRVKQPGNEPLKSQKKIEENDNVKSPKKTGKIEDVPVTPTKGAKEALVILDKCPKISPVKVKCKGDRIMIESLSSSTESDENENCFEIKSKKFRCTPNLKEKANAFALLKSPQAGMENSAKKKTSVKQKKEKNGKNKNEKEKEKKKEKKEDGKIDTPAKNESKNFNKMEVKLIRIDASPSKSSIKTPEKKNEKKSEKKEQKENSNKKSVEKETRKSSNTAKSKVKSKDSGSKKTSKKSLGSVVANKAVKRLVTNEETKFKKSDTSLVVIVEDCQDMPNKDTATNLEPKIMETDSKVLQKKTENSKKKQKTLSEMFNAALQRDKPSSLTRVINKAIEENISSPSVLDLTTPAREKVQHKWEQMREKHKWKFMSAEEKQKIKDERLQKRREKLARQRREKRRLQREEMLKRLEETKKIEDTELELKPLPEGKAIDVPQELTIECFADVIMIVEFILCYKDLLVPEEKFNLTAESLMNALAAEEKGSSILSSVLVIFLQILLQDLQGEKKSRYCGSKLSDMPLTQHSAPELARLYLKRMLSSSSKGNQLERKENSQELLDIIKSMEENEFFTLLPQDKLKLLVSLCHAVISSDAIDNYIEAKKETDMEIKRQKKAEEKEIRDKMKEEKERNEQLKKKELEEQKNSTAENNQDSSNTTEEKSAKGKSVGKTSIITALTAENKKPSEKKDEKVDTRKETSPEKEKNDSTSSGIGQTIRNRRLQLELNKQETEKKKAEELERRLKEEEERRKEQVEQERQANVAKLKQALRITPIGYDRYHRRYWLFTGMSGLYVEDGWMSKYITHVTPETNDECVIDGDRSVTNEESMTSNVKTSNDESVTKSDGDNKTNENGSTNAGSVERALSPDAESKDADVAVVSVQTKQRDKTSAENDQKSSIDKSMRDVPYSWTYYDDPDEINALLEGLASRGIRESALHQVLTNETNIAKNIKKRATAEDKLAQDEGENKMLDYFKQDLLDTADRVTRGNLGEIDKMERYQKSLEKATNLGPLLIKLQESIFPRFLKGSFTEESVINEWRQSALKASTLSLLHLLLEILDSAIVWDKSAENAKCKVCRQKGSDDDLLLLCDECNRGYHLHCLRPAINKIPRGEWKCPSCQPVSSARSQRDRKEMYKDETIEDDSDDSSESEEDADNEIQNEDYCNICQEGGNELVCCDTCPLVFHKDCHDPPLRNIPRGTWSCMECKRPKPRKTRKQQRSKQVAKGSKKKQSKNAPNTRKRKLSSDESSDESFDGRTNRRTMRKRRLDPEDESDEECQKKRRVTQSKKVVIEESEEEEEEESEEEVESDEECQKKRRVTRSKKVVIEESKEEEEEEESEEEEEEEEEDSSEEEKEEGSGSEDEEESENEEEEEEEEEFVVKPQRNKRASNRAEPKPQPKAASRRDKKKAPSKAVKNVANTGSSKRRRTNPELETCEMILIEILRSEDSWPFLVPVNVKEVPDYFDFVSEPMDFQTIKDKLETLQYSDGKSFVHDVQLVFENCDKYNHILSETGQAGERLSNDFKRLLRENLPQYVGNPKRTSRKR